jgi:hypothetical protein
MSGGKDLYEKKLTEVKAQIIAMQVFAGGSISAAEAIEYVCNLPNIKSILFGASSKINILETTDHIRECDRECQHLSI